MEKKKRTKIYNNWLTIYKLYNPINDLFSDGGLDNWEDNGKVYTRLEDVKRHITLLNKNGIDTKDFRILRFIYKLKETKEVIN